MGLLDRQTCAKYEEIYRFHYWGAEALMIRVLIVDEVRLMCQVIAAVLSTESDIELLMVCHTSI